jgi:hypothetical protein
MSRVPRITPSSSLDHLENWIEPTAVYRSIARGEKLVALEQDRIDRLFFHIEGRQRHVNMLGDRRIGI